jgi:hypothetical protein
MSALYKQRRPAVLPAANAATGRVPCFRSGRRLFALAVPAGPAAVDRKGASFQRAYRRLVPSHPAAVASRSLRTFVRVKRREF